MIQRNLQKRLTDLEKKLTVGGEGWGEGIVRGGHTHILILKMYNQQGSTVLHMNCSILCGSLDGRGVWGRMDT